MGQSLIVEDEEDKRAFSEKRMNARIGLGE